MQLLRYLYLSLFSAALLVLAHGEVFPQKVKQPKDVLDAYRVCNRFQQVFAEDLDFDRAYEETFTRDPTRRRAIAIAEGEFGDLDLTSVDDATLITVYKNQMQILFFTLLLIDPDKRELSLPPRIKEIYDRGKARTIKEFRSNADLLKRDVAELRAYLNNDAAAAQRLRDFRSDLSKPVEAPHDYIVRPMTSYSKGRVLGQKEEYYRIGDFSVIREGSEMKLIGIRFFSMLF